MKRSSNRGREARPPHPLVKLALEAIEHYLRTGEAIAPPRGSGEEPVRAGVFVSLKRGGELRGCIGTLRPARRNMLEETVHNAISAAAEDPRFPPLTLDELPGIECTVDVLGEPEPVSDISSLDPREYGVIVESGPRRGLLLPLISGVDTPEEQLSIARRKAGIGPDEDCAVYRFRTRRHS